MEDVENKSVIEETVSPQTENQETEVKEVPQERESPSREHFRRLENSKKDLERELRMQRELNEKLLTMATQLAPRQEAVVDELDKMSDDELLPKGQVKRLVAKEKEKIIQDAVGEIEKRFEQREQLKFKERLQRQFTDFDEVVNPETMALFEEKHPELAQAIVESKDPYKIGLQTYHYIKSMGMSEKSADSRRAKEVDKKIEQNKKTVPSPASYEKRPMAQAFQMTDTLKKQLYNEMMGFAKLAGSVPELQ